MKLKKTRTNKFQQSKKTASILFCLFWKNYVNLVVSKCKEDSKVSILFGNIIPLQDITVFKLLNLP